MSTVASRPITEEMLQEARLGGIPCKAYAYVEATLVEAPIDQHGRRKIVEGVRRWRGKAVVDDAASLSRRRLDKAIRYEGVLLDGNEERRVSADVYVYQTRQAKATSRPHDEAGAPPRQTIYVAFVGAGNTEIQS